MDEKFLQLLGLANRAKKITTGEELVLKAVRSGKASLVVLADDVSSGTEKKVRNKCEYYGVPLQKRFTREELGGAIGKETRAVIGILDKGFAKKLMELLG
ncbi:YlxQ family RNA-binding protein [Listeria aquatica]|uniref:YlxQ family RNA-binding protein n=1 Tax=Listeria aquatica TaxID=1494960 RepID=UPI0031F538A1